jgi:8-oxo-dGTP pyrophosphatase MutT (NUDIX family)
MIEIGIKHYKSEFYFNNEINRKAVSGISFKNGKLLMIESKKVGDYKFPGGGIEKGESEIEALIREVREESGHQISKIGQIIFRIIEESKDKEIENTKFKMVSDYYLCEVKDEIYDLKLDKYENELGFSPLWIGIDDAIKRNIEIINSDNNKKWIKRELAVLNEIINRKIPLTIAST